MIPQRKGSEFMVELSLQGWGDSSVPAWSACWLSDPQNSAKYWLGGVTCSNSSLRRQGQRITRVNWLVSKLY